MLKIPSIFVALLLVVTQRTEAACARDNLVRALDKLQRESNFCAIFLATSTISLPSTVSATPLPTISSACSCVIVSYTTFTTSTTTGCLVSTVTETARTITEPAITITEPPSTVTLPATTVTEPPSTVTLPASTVTEPPSTVTLPASTVTPPAVTITETATTCPVPPAQTSHTVGFENPGRWDGAMQGPYDSSNTLTFGEVENPAGAHSGSWYYRVKWKWNTNRNDGVFLRFVPHYPYKIAPNRNYRVTAWTKNSGASEGTVCYPVFNAFAGQLVGVNEVNWNYIHRTQLLRFGLNLGSTPATWTQMTLEFDTREYDSLSFWLEVTCLCNSNAGCLGKTVEVAWDDIVITPL